MHHGERRNEDLLAIVSGWSKVCWGNVVPKGKLPIKKELEAFKEEILPKNLRGFDILRGDRSSESFQGEQGRKKTEGERR